MSKRRFASVIVSHDRYFLENVTTDMVELNRIYPDGSLRVHGNYSTFLEKKEEFLHAQSLRQEALENLVHREKSNGFAAARKPAPENPKRASAKPAN